ncbi:MAG: hypothetical protein U9P50_03205 [Patescibacteria group bacterium]|nr:hypothetical protein [Patescibacteria group bacterium]
MEEKLSWQALEYEYKDKSADWFWVVWIISLSIAITAYLFNNILFGIFIIISAFSLSIYASRRPSLLNFELSEKGISINEKLIPFNSLRSFWIEDDLKIILQAKRKSTPYIIIPLDKSLDTNKIKEYLLEKLEEEEHHETLSQKIFERLGF